MIQGNTGLAGFPYGDRGYLTVRERAAATA
jgi:hypothetical protein